MRKPSKINAFLGQRKTGRRKQLNNKHRKRAMPARQRPFLRPGQRRRFQKICGAFSCPEPKGAESHASIPRGKEHGLYGDVELPPAGQAAVPESQGTAVAYFIPPGRLCIIRPCLKIGGRLEQGSFLRES